MEERQDGHATELQNHEQDGHLTLFYHSGTGILPVKSDKV